MNTEELQRLKALPQVDLQIQHHFGSGVYMRQMHLPASCMAATHAHRFDHLSILAQGRVMVKVGNEKEIYQAPAVIKIQAGEQHTVLALEESIWFCVHATDEKDLERLDKVLIEAAQ